MDSVSQGSWSEKQRDGWVLNGSKGGQMLCKYYCAKEWQTQVYQFSLQRACVVHWKQKKTQQLGLVPIPILGSLSLTSGENTQMDLYVLWTKITPLPKC